jgi:hypothetical protein
MARMQLAASRYVTFEGTSVVLAPRSPEEAKKALKELRHKKREFAWVKRSLLRQKKAAVARAARATRRKTRKKTWLTRLRRLVDLMTAVPRLFSRVRANIDVADIDRECRRIDEIQHNIDSAILQVEGKLLHQ